MPLGYRNNGNWRDMSECVVHFTKDDEESAYDRMLSILLRRWCEMLSASGRMSLLLDKFPGPS